MNKILETNLNNFANNISYLRKHYGISKKRMSELLGISTATLNKIENGILPKRLSVEILYNIECNFRISPGEIFDKKL